MWVAFYVCISAVSLAALYPMLRKPELLRPMLLPSPAGDVPNATFDYGGLV